MVTLLAKKVKKKYNCNMPELYAGLEIIWKSQGQYEAEFANENTLYTPGLCLVRKAAIDAARALPNGQARGAVAETLRITLLKKHEEAMNKWNSLEGFIKKAFKGEFYKPHIEEAGKKLKPKAMKKNWEVVKQLLVSGRNFISKHSAVLTSDGGMPAGFASQFETVEQELNALFEDFMEARQNAKEQTDAKILANNAIWKDGLSMMADAKNIFRKQAATRHRFTWTKIMVMMGEYGNKKEEVSEVG
jgi:hypothetical protein